MSDVTFHDLELLNINLDVWIDDENYNKVYACIQLDTKAQINKYIENFATSDEFPPRFKIGKNPEKTICLIGSQDNKVLKAKDNWKPLFFAKYLRAKLLQNGTDKYTDHLVDLVMYLQRKLPYQSPQTDQEYILQHLYFQELSACGMPGLESLGFALQAYSLIKDKENTYDNSHYSFELYKLWARYNQGVGYLHSFQKMEAALTFNEVIREFDKEAKDLQPGEKRFWKRLLYDQTLLFKAELLESLQFSYHTIQTLKKLKNTKKKENKLIKEALAFRDMGRLKEAKRKIKALISNSNNDSIKNIFGTFKTWKKDKNNLRSKTLGLLFDYYLLEFKEQKEQAIEKLERDDITIVSNEFQNYKSILTKNKPDRGSYYSQVARFLNWLSECYKETANQFYLEQIQHLYKKIKKDLLPNRSNHSEYGVRLIDFDRYDYDRYTDSMERFYKNLTESKFEQYKEDEKKFYGILSEFEKEKKSHIFFQFNRVEREHRNTLLKWNKTEAQKECKNCLNNTFKPGYMKKLLKGCTSGNGENDDSKCKNGKALETSDYEAIIQSQYHNFKDSIISRSLHKNQEGSINFMGLQRWNSSTPALALSLGGGYFLYKTDEKGKVTLGIAVDPGFNFLENLFKMGFTLSDIDFVLLSHGHSDHIRDFEPMVDLLHFGRRKYKEKTFNKKIHVILSLGVYDRLKNVITDSTYREYLSDTYIIDIDKEINKNIRGGKLHSLPKFKFVEKDEQYVALTDGEKKESLSIEPTWAYHDDKTNISDSFGFIIRFKDNSNVISFGYTGDTKWEESAYKQYTECNVILFHLGSLINQNPKNKKFEFGYYDNPKKCRELIAREGHPYIFGLLHYMTQLAKACPSNSKKVILISEFGEELKGGIRTDLIEKLSKTYKEKLDFLPVDIGLNLSLLPGTTEGFKVLCIGCNNFVKLDRVRFDRYGHGYDEALFYFCDTCIKSKPLNVLQDKMRNIAEFGFPLRKTDNA